MIALAAPCVPDPASLSEDADLVLIAADKASLAPAMARMDAYRQIKQATLLVYLQDREQPSPDIPGLAMLRSELPAGPAAPGAGHPVGLAAGLRARGAGAEVAGRCVRCGRGPLDALQETASA